MNDELKRQTLLAWAHWQIKNPVSEDSLEMAREVLALAEENEAYVTKYLGLADKYTQVCDRVAELIDQNIERRHVTKVSKYMAEAESLERKCNQLAEENKKLRYSTAADYLRKWSDEDYDELSSENDKLRAEVEKLKKDAARYTCLQCGEKYTNTTGMDLYRENARLREALEFYAKQEHFAGLETFDTISGEPQNYLAPDGEGCELCQQAVIEDGHIARAALEQSTKGET